MLLLSYFGHAYVWGEQRPATALPAPVAVPWVRVAAALGRPPVLSYASYALDNWKRLTPAGPIALGNIAVLQNFLGGIDEEWFILVHIEIEARAAAALRAASDALGADDVTSLTAALRRLDGALRAILRTLSRMPEHCDPYIYFHRVRPYIHGWRDHPALAEGVVYEGVNEFAGAPQRFRGETGAQSSIMPVIDATLGITHSEDSLVAYLREMREYMPPRHRDLIAYIERSSHVRDTVERSGSSAAVAAYNGCIERIAAFRGTHLEYAGRYVYRQSRAWAANPATVGTGGTPFIPYLSKHRDETLVHRLQAPGRFHR